MSGPKARCPSCGTEWEGPVVFCGECGSPVLPAAGPGAPGDRVARVPAPGGSKGARPGRQTLVGALPGVPVSPSAAPPPPVGKPTLAMPSVQAPEVVGDRPARPSDAGRRTAVGMQAVSPAGTDEREARPQRREAGGKKGRRASMSGEEAPRSEARPAEEAPQIEVTPISETTLLDPKAIPPAAAAAPPVVADAPAQAIVEAVKPAEIAAFTTGEVAKPQAQPADAPVAREPAQPAAGEKPGASPSVVPPHEADETKRLLEDLDAGFDSIVRPSAPDGWGAPVAEAAPPALDPRADPVSDPHGAAPNAVDDAWLVPLPPPEAASPAPRATGLSDTARAARHEADMAEVRELFAGIAVAYARPLRDFMIEVAWGEPTIEWLDVALPAATSLRRAAAAVELPELDAALEGYAAALELATGESSIHLEVRELLAGAYARLVEAMPSVFALDRERGRREPIIVRSLLLQVPGVHKVTIDKLYAAGINGLDVLYAVRPRELAETTGLDEALAVAISERFQRYRREVAELSPGKDRENERAELQRLTGALAQAHEAFERASRDWSADAAARKANARKERADAALAIDLLLAHLGEVDLQRALAKLPFQQKIRELSRHLEEAKQKASPRGLAGSP